MADISEEHGYSEEKMETQVFIFQVIQDISFVNFLQKDQGVFALS